MKLPKRPLEQTDKKETAQSAGFFSEEKSKKLKYFFTTSEAAKFLGVSDKTLRNWEAQGRISPKKTKGGNRKYTLRELKSLEGQKSTHKNTPSAFNNYAASYIEAHPSDWQEKLVHPQPLISSTPIHYRNEEINPPKPLPQAPEVKEVEISQDIQTIASLAQEKHLYRMKGSFLQMAVSLGVVVLTLQLCNLYLPKPPQKPNQKAAHSAIAIRNPIPDLAKEMGITLPKPSQTSSFLAEAAPSPASSGEVLAATTDKNVRLELNTDVKVNGNITADNLIQSLQPGTGITIDATNPNNPVISAAANGVTSIANTTGAITLGTGLSISNNKVSVSQSLADVRGVGGCSGCITSSDLATSYLSGTVGIGSGGTGLTTYTIGDIPYASAADTLSKLAIGTSGQVLTVVNGVPAWSTSGSGSTVDGLSGALTISNTSGSGSTITIDSATTSALGLASFSSSNFSVSSGAVSIKSGGVTTNEIADGTITGSDLSSSVAINTSGLFTGTGGANLTENGNLSTSYGLYIKRNTDTTPAGYLIRAQNNAGTSDLFSVDTSGNITTAGTISSGSGTGTTLTLTPSTDTTALTLVGTNVTTQNLAYFNAHNAQGTIFNIAYGATQTLTGNLTGESIDLNNGQVTNNNFDITGLNVKLPTVTDSNTTGTVNIKGLTFGFGSGTGINQTGAGATNYSGVDISLPALTQTAGTLTSNGVNVTTSSQITTGGTANGLNIAATGVGAGSLNGVNVSSITGGLGTETAFNIGSGWDNALSVNGTQIINGSGVTQIAGGGTGTSTYAKGDILYASATNTLSKLPIGTAGQVLTVASGLPSWATGSGGGTCTDCVLTDPTTSTSQTITPSADIVSLLVRQTTTASPTSDIFDVTNSAGTTKYFSIDKSGNVSTAGTSGQTLTLTPTTDTTALTLVGTNVATSNLQYINSKNSQGTILNLAYGAAQTLSTSTALTGFGEDLSTNVTATNSLVNGISLTLPGVTNTNTSGTKTIRGLVVSAGGGINQNAAGSTVFSGADITIPALTQTSGTLTGNGVLITTPSSITTAGTANGLNIAATGVSVGALNGVNISGITAGAGTETALNIGSGWDSALTVGGTSIINGSGVLQSAGLSGTYSNTLTLSGASNSITAGTLTATGGTINNTTIGSTTAAAGTFTTLTANTSATLGVASSTTGSLIFKNATNSNTITFSAPSGASAPSSSLTFTLPNSTGSNGQCLTTDGSGGLSFGNCGGTTFSNNGSVANGSSLTVTTNLGSHDVTATAWVYDGSAYRRTQDNAFFNKDTNSTIATGLLGFWAMNESSGTTTVADSLGSFTGTMKGTSASTQVTTSGALNNARVFDGSTNYVDVGSNSNLTSIGNSSFTFSTWLKLSTTGYNSGNCGPASVFQGLYGSDTTGGMDIQIDGGANTDCSVNIMKTGTGTEVHASTTIIPNTNWHHIVVTYDGTNVKTYLDGTLKDTIAMSANLFTAGADMHIGEDAGGNYTNGDMDETGLWNRALSATEVADLYNSGSADFFNPANSYKVSQSTDGNSVSLLNNSGATQTLRLDIQGGANGLGGGFFSGNNSSLADGSALTVTHNLNSNDISTTAWVKDAATGYYQKADAGQGLDPSLTDSTHLRGWWKLNEASGTVTDSSGASNTLTNNGTPTYSEPDQLNRDGAIKFDGASSYFSCTNASCGGTSKLNPSTNMTIGGWIKLNSTGINQAVMGEGNWAPTATDSSWILEFRTDNKLYLYVASSGTDTGTNYIATNNTFSANTWYFVSVNYNGGTVKIYVNGAPVATTTTGSIASTIRTATSGPFELGAFEQNSAQANYFNGWMNDPFVFSSTLTDQQVANLYQYGLHNYLMYEPDTNSVKLLNYSGSAQDVRLDVSAGGSQDWSRNATSGYTYTSTSTDSVGIGTSTPTSQLQVVTSNTTNNALKDVLTIGHTTSTSSSYTGFTDDTGGTLDTSLVSYYKMDESSGSTTVADSAGTNTGTSLSSTNVTTGILGNARTVSSTSNFVKFTNPSYNQVTGGKLSINLWINEQSNTNGQIFSMNLGNIQIWHQANDNVAVAGDTGGVITTGTALPHSAWHMVTAVWDGTNVTVYIDGVSKVVAASTVTNASADNAQLGVYCTGAGSTTCSAAANDYYDEMGVWSKALTQKEINDLYNNGKANAFLGTQTYTGQNGIGTGLLFQTTNSSGSTVSSGRIENTLVSTVAGSENGMLAWDVISGGTLTREGKIDYNGNLTIKGSLTSSGSPDIAENIPVTDPSIGAGDVVMADPNFIASDNSSIYDQGAAKKAETPYESKILGVISSDPGITLNAPKDSVTSGQNTQANERPLALAGRVPVKVSTINGPITAGDFLTSSPIPGVAMKATQSGEVIGKALESYSGDTAGTILVFVNIGYEYIGATTAFSIPVPTSGLTVDSGSLNPAQIAQITRTSDQAGIDLTLGTGGVFSIKDASGSAVATIDDQGNATFKTLTVDKLRANQIEGLEVMVAGIATQSASQTSTEVASQSASLAQLNSNLSALDSKLTNPSVLLASDSAQLNKVNVSDTLSALNLTSTDATVSGTLNVLTQANLPTTSIAGDLSVDGTFSITSASDGTSLNALTTLHIQNSPLAELVDFFNGLVTIDNKGNITSQGAIKAPGVTTNVLTISNQPIASNSGVLGTNTTSDSPSIGAGKIASGSTSVVISTKIVSSNSKIFITPTTPTDKPLFIGAIKEGEGFEVDIASAPITDVSFNWWIVNNQ